MKSSFSGTAVDVACLISFTTVQWHPPAVKCNNFMIMLAFHNVFLPLGLFVSNYYLFFYVPSHVVSD